MAKKKKGSKKKKKPSLSKLERETLKLQIEDRQNRIEWRKAEIDILKEDIKFYQEKYELLQSDKENCVTLLEDAIKNQTLRNKEIRAAIPEAEQKKRDSETAKIQELSKFLMAIDEEKLKDIEELDTLKKNANTIESYDVENGVQKISDLENKFESHDNDKNAMRTTLKLRQEKALRAEMKEIFKEKAKAYQENCSGKLDKNIERITEETRWWKDSGDILLSMEDSLEQKYAAIKGKIKEEKEKLKQRKDQALKVSIMVEEQKSEIVKIEERNRKLKKREEQEAQLLKEQKLLVSQREVAKQDLEELSSKLQNCKSIVKHNEYYIKNMEDEISKANRYASELKKTLEKANILITEEVKFPLIKKGNENPNPKYNELENLFDEATKQIWKHSE